MSQLIHQSNGELAFLWVYILEVAQVPGLCASNPLAAILFCKLLARPSLHGDHFLIAKY